MLIISSLLVLLANAASKNDHVFGMNGCEATPFPRKQIDGPVAEFFYSLQIDDIPGFEYNKAEGTVKMPMGTLLKGWYYHDAPVMDLEDAGVVEWFFFPNPVSLFKHANWGTAENLMSVMKDGTMDLARQADVSKMREAGTDPEEDDNTYVWENADRDRRHKVNQHAFLTMAQKQFADMSFDQKQSNEVLANPDPVPDFAPFQQKLKDAVADVNFPLHPGTLDNDDLKIATNCLHGESDEVTDEYFIIKLNEMKVYSKGQTIFPIHTWTNVAGKSWWKVDEEMGTLDLLFEGFQMGYLDAKQPKKTLQYFQSPPWMQKDNRVNEDAPRFGNPNAQRPWCTYVDDLQHMQMDTHMFWEPLERVCTPDMIETFQDLIMKENFNTLVDHPNNVRKGLKLIEAATDYVMCGNNYIRSYIKYSHGYDFLAAGAFIHYLLEFYPPFTVPFLTHKDLNKFKVDYIYGQTAPTESPDAAPETVTMVESYSGSYLVNGFALVGIGSLLYGAYAHYFGTKPGDSTQLEMA